MSQQPPRDEQPFIPPPPPTSNSPYSPDELAQKASQVSSDATQALIFGIIGLVCCGFIFGFLAYRKGSDALETMDIYEVGQHLRGQAKIGRILGIIDIIGWIILIIFRIMLLVMR